MNKIEEAITEHWGERCKDFAKGCPCCDAWAEYDVAAADMRAIKAQRDRLQQHVRELQGLLNSEKQRSDYWRQRLADVQGVVGQIRDLTEDI